MIFKDLAIKIPRREVLSRLKFNEHKTKLTKNVSAIIDEMMDEGAIISDYQGCVEDFVIARRDGKKIFLEGSEHVFESESLAEHLKDSYKVTFIVCTIGKALGEKVAAFLDEQEVTKAAVLDAVGSEAVEAIIKHINDLVLQQAKEQHEILTRRFSPGYGDWPIKAQREVLLLVKAENIDVSVNEYCFLQPEKSVSAIVGWMKK